MNTEHNRLLAEFTAATLAFNAAIKALDPSAERARFAELIRRSDEARSLYENARLAVERHRTLHGF